MSALSPLRDLAVRALREAQLWPRLLARRGAGRRVAFLPGEGRMQSSLLRGYNMADELRLLGWDTLVVPARLGQGQRARVLRAFRPDLVVVLQCRHPLNRAELLADWPLVLDIDDADWFDPRRVPALTAMARQARGVICGSRFVRDWALGHNPASVVIWTGTPASAEHGPPQAARAPLVTWAQSHALGYADEFALIRQVLGEVARRRGGVDFRLYGWDGPADHPALVELRSAGVRVETMPFMDYSAFLLSMRDVAVGLSAIAAADFSQGKSFGKILVYLDAGVPVICSDAADHALFFRPDSGVVSNDPAVWVDAICRLLDDAPARQAMANAALVDFSTRLSSAAAGRRVADFLSQLLAGDTTGPPLANAIPGSA